MGNAWSRRYREGTAAIPFASGGTDSARVERPRYFHNLGGSSRDGLRGSADSALTHCAAITPATKNIIVTVSAIVSHGSDNVT